MSFDEPFRVDAAFERWFAAAPRCLHVLRDELVADFSRGGVGDSQCAKALELLRAAYPDERVRALTLLAWAEAPRQDGAHEQFPDVLVAAMPLDALLASLIAPGASDAHITAAVRMHLGWDFDAGPSDLRHVPDPVVARLRDWAARKNPRSLPTFDAVFGIRRP